MKKFAIIDDKTIISKLDYIACASEEYMVVIFPSNSIKQYYKSRFTDNIKRKFVDISIGEFIEPAEETLLVCVDFHLLLDTYFLDLYNSKHYVYFVSNEVPSKLSEAFKIMQDECIELLL